MSKKKGLFSWFSKKPAKKTEQEEQEILAQEKAIADEKAAQAEAELQAKEAAELAAKQQAELEAKEAAELAAKQKAEQEAKEAAELAAKQKAEQEAKEAAELAAKQKAEQEAKEAAELAAKQKAEQEAKEAAELAAKQKAEQEAKEAAELAAKQQAELEAKEAELAAKEKAEADAKIAARNAYQEAQRNAELARQQIEQELAVEAVEEVEAEAVDISSDSSKEDSKEEQKLGFFARFAQGLKKTRLSIGSGLLSLFKGKKIDDELFEELEEQLIIADIGVETTLRIIDNLTDHADRKQLKDAEALYELLKKDLSDILDEVERPLVIDETKKPYVILMVGVNGVGKTTTIGKLAKKYQSEGKSVMLAAGDTFRAAAVEQLQVWGERNDIPVIAQQTGADSASVLFDAMDAAQARGIDVLIADTAGRLQNKDNLMTELSKIVRIMRKKDITAPHEIMLTIDAGTGQNAISQVKIFNEAVGLTGLTFTKLDGTAKGGIIFSIADQFKLPIRYIGVGEGIDDLREFNSKEFIDALFTKEEDA
ncbi:signal recognition particle-docking protein FtsY [Psychromonas aquatilis]|uniref:Signal recognition particle receptor FtsY n=1 Tax=Psychromonas aquatilis TaxID=2005072 RepID=A0ABU9GQY6_9GAMM